MKYLFQISCQQKKDTRFPQHLSGRGYSVETGPSICKDHVTKDQINDLQKDNKKAPV